MEKTTRKKTHEEEKTGRKDKEEKEEKTHTAEPRGLSDDLAQPIASMAFTVELNRSAVGRKDPPLPTALATRPPFGISLAPGRMDTAEWTCIATRAVSRCAGRAQIPNPFVAKWFGFPSSAWARQIYLLPGSTLEPASDGAPGPAVGAADFSGRRVVVRSGAAMHVCVGRSLVDPVI